MLSQLEEFAREQHVQNIRTVKCAWEDDWDEKQIGQHDLVIASRSMNIDNLAAGIQKLEKHALKQVVIADRISPSPFDPDVFAAIGRDFNSGPDYIYTLNMLHRPQYPSPYRPYRTTRLNLVFQIWMMPFSHINGCFGS